jgi:hypothetical protein
MEGPHPVALTEDDTAAKLLLRGIDDWISLDEARWAVSLVEPGTAEEVREATLRALALLVENGLARLGALGDEFEPWDLAPAAAMQRLRREWWDPEKELRPGNICWMENTTAGTDIARSLEAARDS